VFFRFERNEKEGHRPFRCPFFYTTAPSLAKEKHTTTAMLSPFSLGPTLARARAPPAPKKIPPRRKK
jgi:hypothetical protein